MYAIAGGESHRLVVDAKRATMGEGHGICGGGGMKKAST